VVKARLSSQSRIRITRVLIRSLELSWRLNAIVGRRRCHHGKSITRRSRKFEIILVSRLEELRANGLRRWATSKGSRVTTGRVAAVVDFIDSAATARHGDHAKSWSGHLREGVVDLGEKQGEISLLATTESGYEGEELVEVIAGAVLESVLLEGYARHDIGQCACNVKELLDESNAVDLHSCL
jgi:hypothetical protein